MPCEEIIQVVGTLIPQDKESFGSVTSHEENAIFIFEESRTLLSNQLALGYFLKITQEPQSFRKEPSLIKHLISCNNYVKHNGATFMYLTLRTNSLPI
ncbi:hypothetical protein ACTWQL_10030 [Pseudalkalibacillus sp. R45]|uniref:hypothetical protein n=1 Tax=Pseudalkalibacillus sp. R45 TaxID=3457433 RepID=UPI003FCC43AD